MERVARLGMGLLLSVLLIAPACSADKKPTDAQGSVSTVPGAAVAGDGSATSPETPDATDVTGPASADPGVPTTTAGSSGPTSGSGATGNVPVAAGGWRLAVSYPTAGSTIGRAAVVCYEATGPGGQADVALEVTVGAGSPVRVAGSVGRGSAHVDLTPDPDPHDLRVQLIVNGARIAGGVVTIPAVLVVPAASEPACP